MKLLKESDVPEGMVGNVPWTQTLQQWTPAMLNRALAHVDDSPMLARAIRAEIASR